MFINNKKREKCSKSHAFTLAEVLITLGVIGVVAAVSLNVIKNIRYQHLHTLLEQDYAMLQKALLNLSNDLGYLVTRDNFGVTSMTETGFCKYFNYAECVPFGSYKGKNQYEYIDGISKICKNYLTHNKSTQAQSNLCDDGMVFLNNGTLIFRDYQGYFIVDVNGPYKKPNAFGYDVFAFEIDSNGKLSPMKPNNFTHTCSTSKENTSAGNGLSCTYAALTDKNYWKNLP